jgi:hypothetical protein
MDAFPSLKSHNGLDTLTLEYKRPTGPLVELNGTTITIRDFLTANYVKTIAGTQKGCIVSEMQVEVMKICNVEKIFAKMRTKVSTKKNMPNEFLKFIYHKNIHAKLTSIITKINGYISTFDFARYEYNIFEATDIPNLIIVEKSPKNAYSSAFSDECICHLFIHNNTVLVNFSEINTMRF